MRLKLSSFARNIGCPTTYQTRHFFNNSKTKKDIATKQTHTTDTFLFISHTTNVLLFNSHCNIFIGFRIIKEMPGLVGSGTPCTYTAYIAVNLLKPTGHVMHHQFNIQQLYALPTLYLCVLYLSENKQQLVSLTA